MTENQTLKVLYTAVDRRQSGSTANAISQRLRTEYKIATGEGMVGNRELLDSISALNVTADSRLVDLGSGTAEPSRWIAGMTGCHLTAVDVSSDRLARIPTIDAIHAACTDLNAGLPFRDSTFNACVQYDSIVHISDRGAFLDELRRIAEAGAVLALTSSTNGALTDDEQLGLGDVAGTIWRLTTAELDALLERHGWSVTLIRSRRAEMLAYHVARCDALLEARNSLTAELPDEGFERLVSRATTVASLLERQRLDMIFVTAVRRS